MTSTDVYESVFRISSSDPKNKRFGTAFAFYSGEDTTGHEATYFLTAKHVFENAREPSQLQVSNPIAGNYPAKVVATGPEDSLEDVAVLQVEGLTNVPILKLTGSGEVDNPVMVIGFAPFPESFVLRSLKGKLGRQVLLESSRQPGGVAAWDVKIEDEYELERGYSGGPIVDARSGDVVAIGTYRAGGRKGVALSIETFLRLRQR